ncbi:MAG: hypothetical protein PVG84_13275 [Desulfobacterales bacterium]|jgi:uncharacterized membrane protein YgcG
MLMKFFTSLLQKSKKIARFGAVATALVVTLPGSLAWGDEIDDNLPANTPEAVRTIARQAIRSGLDQQSVASLTQAMLENKFDTQQIQQAYALMIEAKNSGMPVKPLMSKAFEGMAKNVPATLILNAMQAVQSRNAFAHRQAARLTDHKNHKKILGRTLAAGLAAGLSKKDVAEITNMVQQHLTSMNTEQSYRLALECFQTARDVSRLGVSSSAVTGMLTQAIKKGFNDEDMRNMRNSFVTQARHVEPQNLARGYTTAIQQGKDFSKDAGGSNGRSGGSGSGGSGVGGSSGSGGSGSGSGEGSGGPGGSGGGDAGGSGPGGGGSGGRR